VPGREKNGAQAIGRSRGGLTTKINALVDALVDALGNPVHLILTPGHADDLARAAELIEAANPDALIADKAFDADPFIATLTQREITPVIAESEPQNPTALRFRAIPRTQPRRALLQ
jgi:transposase